MNAKNAINAMNAKNSFETSLSSLEKIVRKLEEGDLTLEESLKLFEDGVRLSRECQERLNQAERRIEILLKDEDGNPVLQTLEKDNLSDETHEPKIKRRIVFDEEEKDESPF
ncbi:MAG: exodeoxyribonuclease VII small subunit [Pyrinomonadaceae bacterium]